jgi:hypothetical protein
MQYEDVFMHCASCEHSEIFYIPIAIRPNALNFRDKNKIQRRKSAKCKISHCHYSPIKGEMTELEKRK